MFPIYFDPSGHLAVPTSPCRGGWRDVFRKKAKQERLQPDNVCAVAFLEVVGDDAHIVPPPFAEDMLGVRQETPVHTMRRIVWMNEKAKNSLRDGMWGNVSI